MLFSRDSYQKFQIMYAYIMFLQHQAISSHSTEEHLILGSSSFRVITNNPCRWTGSYFIWLIPFPYITQSNDVINKEAFPGKVSLLWLVKLTHWMRLDFIYFCISWEIICQQIEAWEKMADILQTNAFLRWESLCFHANVNEVVSMGPININSASYTAFSRQAIIKTSADWSSVWWSSVWWYVFIYITRIITCH